MSTSLVKNRSIACFIASKNFNETEFFTCKTNFEKQGFNFIIVSDSNGSCIGDSGKRIHPDIKLFNLNMNNFVALVVIGGKGTADYQDNEKLLSEIQKCYSGKKIIAAICNGPALLACAGILKDKSVSCNLESAQFIKKHKATVVDQNITMDVNIITAQGPEDSEEFANKVVYEINKKLMN